ncbi:MAG: hypothetical protein V2A58_10145 [Planctomycetota bacterium]
MAKRRQALANPASAAHFERLAKVMQKSSRTGKPHPPMEKRAVHPYADGVQEPVVYGLEMREYHHPFNYRNIVHKAFCSDPAMAGLELNPVNSVDSRTNDSLPADYLELTEKNPIVRLVVIGSACTPPGYIQIEVDPCEGFRRPDELPGVTPARFRIDNLWGMHLRGDVWMKEAETPGAPLPEHFVRNWPYSHVKDFKDRYVLTGVTSRNMPLAGMSCAIFEIPAACRVRIMGGSVNPGWTVEKSPNDGHYAFRIIRATVITRSKVEKRGG